MLVIGAYANTKTPYTAGQLHSLETFMYGRFVASMKGSNQDYTASAFYIKNLDDELPEMNGHEISPGFGSSLWTNMSEEML